MPPKKLVPADAKGMRPLGTSIVRADSSPPEGLDTSYDKWTRNDFKKVPGAENVPVLHQFLLAQATIRGLATGQQNKPNGYLEFVIQKYDQLLENDNKKTPTARFCPSICRHPSRGTSNCGT